MPRGEKRHRKYNQKDVCDVATCSFGDDPIEHPTLNLEFIDWLFEVCLVCIVLTELIIYINITLTISQNTKHISGGCAVPVESIYTKQCKYDQNGGRYTGYEYA